MGYLLTGILTILLALVGAMVLGQTVMQLRLGIQFGIGQLIGKVVTWLILGGVAVWLSAVFLRSLNASAGMQKDSRRAERRDYIAEHSR